jgi:hypothetical protein
MKTTIAHLRVAIVMLNRAMRKNLNRQIREMKKIAVLAAT